MKPHFFALLACGALLSLAPSALAHPGSGIVVDQPGNVYFTHIGRGVGKIDREGRLTYVGETRGGHWMCLDAEGSFSRTQPKHFERITPGATLDRKQANFAGKPYAVPDGPDAGPSLKRATKVGSYPANAWKLHDMHGNEFEWCRDWYHTKLPGGVDPDLYSVQGTRNGDGTYSRARRGGSWGDDGQACRSALRLRYEPPRGAYHIGFRVVGVRL